MNLFQRFRDSTRETKWFIFNVMIWLLLSIVTTVYVYARLDFVRSGQPSYMQQTNETKNND